MREKRRGSALLIVIGMLSFMVISAVGFSVFMRQSRVPSSYLRRNSAARYLLKAALANAISRLDGCPITLNQVSGNDLSGGNAGTWCEGVYDDAYPGVAPQSGTTVSGLGTTQNGGYFSHRVFMPFGQVGQESTVSTLTLEGLAYLPPAIINEVRVFSRRTRTAIWRHLAYDSGRYAFCAVDVSDCFDINRLCAEERRLSTSGERLNLSSLFPDNAGDLESILEKCSLHCESGGGKIPFVSLADFNIVAENSPFAPFYRYIGTSGSAIYNSGDYESVSNALFITDTWFPPTNTVNAVKRIDLEAGDDKQPFSAFTDSANFLDPAKNETDLCRILRKNIGGVGLACLYDYLDKNSRPISFVVPTVETVPMVCGLGLAHNSRFVPQVTPGTEITSKEIAQGNDPNVTYKYKSKKYSLAKLMDELKLSGVVTFPFKRATVKKDFNGTFTGEALVKVFFGPKAIKSRLNAGSPLYPATKADWADGCKRGIVTVKCPISGISFATDVKKTTEAVKQFTADIAAQTLNAPLFHHVREFKVVKDPESGAKTETETENSYYSLDGIKASDTALVPRDADGNEVNWWKNAAAADAEPTEGGEKPTKATATGVLPDDEYVPHVLVWVRIMNSNQETVDIVPARVDDDGTWGASAFDAQGMADKFGPGTPVLEFRGDGEKAFKYEKSSVEEKLNGSPDTFPQWTQIYAVDPRYNHAPENWFAKTGNGDATADEWLKAIGADGETANGILGKGGRDRDIFMFTSDQEVMQSIGELAFLPYVQEMDGSGDFFENDYLDGCAFNGNDFTQRLLNDESLTDTSQFASGAFMWRTYTAFDNGDGSDPIYSLRDGSTPVEIAAGQRAFRVNPFSPDSRVLMAALRDTPFDYTVASDNEELNKTVAFEPAKRAQFAFCKDSSVAKLDDDELADIAAEMQDHFQAWARDSGKTAQKRGDWMAAYRDLLWRDRNNNCNDGQTALFGLDGLQSPLHGVDRKYLYSFWHECFQNRQQLFLVFIRAEPLTVGGAGQGSLAASQLGARGVALVWRDPQPPTGDRPARENLTSTSNWKSYYENCAPHRTRVLFYHQFD